MVSPPIGRSLRIASAFLFAACAPPGDYAYEAGEPGDPPLYELREEMRIASDESATARALTRVISLSLLPDSSIVIAHMPAPHFRVYSSAGAMIASFGTEGSGPGEFTELYRHGSFSDTIWAIGNSRLSFFTAAGQELGTVSLPSAFDGKTVQSVLAVLDSGTLLLEREHVTRSPTTGTRPDSVEHILARPDGSISSSLQAFALPANSMIEVNISGKPVGYRQFLFGRSVVAAAPEGRTGAIVSDAEYWGGDPGQVRVVRFNSSGAWDTVYVALPPRAGTREYVESRIAALKSRVLVRTQAGQNVMEGGDDEALRTALRARAHVPEYFPVVATARVGSDGSVWLTHPYDPGHMTVIVGDRAAMRVSLPARTTILWVSATHAWGVQLGRDDVPAIVRFQVAQPSPG